jgi:hypothetical protein
MVSAKPFLVCGARRRAASPFLPHALRGKPLFCSHCPRIPAPCHAGGVKFQAVRRRAHLTVCPASTPMPPAPFGLSAQTSQDYPHDAFMKIIKHCGNIENISTMQYLPPCR